MEQPVFNPDPKRVFTDVVATDSTVKISEFTLADGTVLKVQPIIVSIKRVDGELDSEGMPKYIANFAFSLVKDCSRFSAPQPPADPS